MRGDQREPPDARAAYGCLAIIVPLAIAVAVALVVFAWNVNAPA